MVIIPLYKKQNLCTVVKFIAALLVINGHLFLFGGNNTELCRFMNLGTCCVGLFFFFSGYGLTYSYATKGNAYLKNFFNRRLVCLLLPLVTAYIIALPVYTLINGPIHISTLLSTLLWGGPYLKFSWFVSEITVVYLLYFIAMKSGGTRIAKLTRLTLLIVVLMGVLFATSQPLWYSVSLPGFILGIWYCEFEKSILSRITNTRICLTLLVSFLIWLICWQWNSFGAVYLPEYRYAVVASFLSVIFFTTFIIWILLSVNEVRAHRQGGVISSFYEIYLNQNVIFIIVSTITTTFFQYWCLSLILIVMLAVVMHQINNRLSSYYPRKKKKELRLS